VPRELCFDCGDRVLAEWVATENQLLNRAPAYATAVAEVILATSAAQKRAILTSVEEPSEHARWERQKAGRKLARFRRAHRAEIASIDQSRWQELAEAMTHDPRETLRKEAKKLTKRGLGAAALTKLSVEVGDLIFRRLRSSR